MELYKLGTGMTRATVIDKFISAIWTERYSKPGDVTLVVDPTPENFTLFYPGGFLGISDSDEVMLIETLNVKNNQLIVSGPSLLNSLAYRLVYADQRVDFDRSLTVTGQTYSGVIENIVDWFAVGPMPFSWTMTDIGGIETQAITGLTTEDLTSPPAGPDISVLLTFDYILPIITKLAEIDSFGLSLYLNSASEVGATYKFKVYEGIDRTTEIRFSPKMDTLADISELYSSNPYKNVAVVSTPVFDQGGIIGKTYHTVTEASTEFGTAEQFNRRVVHEVLNDVTQDMYGVGAAPGLDVQAMLSRRATEILGENKYVQAIDGEVVTTTDDSPVFGVDYNLGDIVELEGLSGTVQDARITEYIRTQDAAGERSYPTVSVIT